MRWFAGFRQGIQGRLWFRPRLFRRWPGSSRGPCVVLGGSHTEFGSRSAAFRGLPHPGVFPPRHVFRASSNLHTQAEAADTSVGSVNAKEKSAERPLLEN